MSRAWSKGSTRAWRALRDRVLERDGYACRLQIPGVCTGEATHVHHILGKGATRDEDRYLISACLACNLHVGDPRRPGHADPEPRPITRW